MLCLEWKYLPTATQGAHFAQPSGARSDPLAGTGMSAEQASTAVAERGMVQVRSLVVWLPVGGFAPPKTKKNRVGRGGVVCE